MHVCLLLVSLRHAAVVVAGQQVYVVEPRLTQLLQVGQTVTEAAALTGVQVLAAERTVLATQVVRD